MRLTFLLLLIPACSGVYIRYICSHDGRIYSNRDKIKIGCDVCTCDEGKINCPTPLKCPRECLFRGQTYDDNSVWKDNCKTCECHDGTVNCNLAECPDKCEVNGVQYEKGDEFLKDCNTCTCQGYNKLSCTDESCHCYNGDGKEVEHGDQYLDAECNLCVCKEGVGICMHGGSCPGTESCAINNKVIKHGEEIEMECLVFACNNGSLELKANSC